MLFGTALVLTMMTTAPVTVASPTSMATPEATAQRAYEMFATPAEWKEAGMLLLKAAREQGGTDLRAVEWTLNAGRALHAAGDLEGARAAFQLAGDRGTAAGAVAQAATAYLSAAAIAATTGEGRDAESLARKAELLSQSPHIDERVRRSIRNRLG